MATRLTASSGMNEVSQLKSRIAMLKANIVPGGVVKHSDIATLIALWNDWILHTHLIDDLENALVSPAKSETVYTTRPAWTGSVVLSIGAPAEGSLIRYNAIADMVRYTAGGLAHYHTWEDTTS